MMRSFFGTQEGEFDIDIRSIAAATFGNNDNTSTEGMASGKADAKSASILQEEKGKVSIDPGLFCSKCTVS